MSEKAEIQISLTPESQREVGIIFNSKRPEYSDLIKLWKSKSVQQLLSDHFSDMFETSNQGKWKISSRVSAAKVELGYDPRPNIMTGAMYYAMSRPLYGNAKSKSTGFPASLAFRRYNKQSMAWGVNVSDPVFAGKTKPYPLERNAINEFAFLDDKFASNAADIFADYFLDIMEKIGKTRL